MTSPEYGPLEGISFNGEAATDQEITKLENSASFLTDPMPANTYRTVTYKNDDGGIIAFKTDSYEWEQAALPEGSDAKTHPSLRISAGKSSDCLLSIRFNIDNVIEVFPTTSELSMARLLAILGYTRQVRDHSDDELAVLDYAEKMAEEILVRRNHFVATSASRRASNGTSVHIADTIRAVVEDGSSYGIIAKRYTDDLADGGRLIAVNRSLTDELTLDPTADTVPVTEVILTEDFRQDRVRHRYRRLNNNQFGLTTNLLPISDQGITRGPDGSIVLTVEQATRERQIAGMYLPRAGAEAVAHLNQVLFKACMQTIDL
ncbi:MAG: hypothetical protein ABIQ89_00035 [Candidatus Saccharimonadales bacterium]